MLCRSVPWRPPTGSCLLCLMPLRFHQTVTSELAAPARRLGSQEVMLRGIHPSRLVSGAMSLCKAAFQRRGLQPATRQLATRHQRYMRLRTYGRARASSSLILQVAKVQQLADLTSPLSLWHLLHSRVSRKVFQQQRACLLAQQRRMHMHPCLRRVLLLPTEGRLCCLCTKHELHLCQLGHR